MTNEWERLVKKWGEMWIVDVLPAVTWITGRGANLYFGAISCI